MAKKNVQGDVKTKWTNPGEIKLQCDNQQVLITDDVLLQIYDAIRAIKHPLRMAIIELLESSDLKLNVNKVAEILGLEQSVVSQHLAILRKQHFISENWEGKFNYYALDKAYFQEFSKIVELSKSLDLISTSKQKPKGRKLKS
ncbi:MAG: winged helix-turn-helix transcriptional regulator [Candidatus Peribacteria bacterium]|nr:MAG: winged helix-turn-helix transcriptional regulator [Candidatus Peribacteria bacterium]